MKQLRTVEDWEQEVCENLIKAGLLHDPRRVAALEAVAEAARAALDVDPTSRAGAEAHIRLEAALDAASAAETHEVDVRPMTDDEIRAEQLTQPAGDPWLARCTCGAEMLPLYPGGANAWEQGHLGTRPWVQA
jgi:hypothetical protein